MRRLLALLLTAAPFVAGGIAALSARRDLRMLWMAAVATVIARLIVRMAPARQHHVVGVAAALVAATVAASAVAVLLGARAPFGIGAVAVVLSGCAVAGALLAWRQRAAV
jgi:hypothetical protein